MKKNFIIMSMLISFYATSQARVGCMDNSFHAYLCNEGKNCCQVDYKLLHFVECACPCNEYVQYDARAKCSRCQHYHVAPLSLGTLVEPF